MAAILGLALLMLLLAVGASTSRDALGFRYWRHPGPMNEYLRPGALGRFLAFLKVFTQATYAYGGVEMVVVVAAGKAEDPRRSIPKAVRRVFWRIALFYLASVFLVGLCVSSRDPALLDAVGAAAPGAAQSPFVVAINNAGIAALPSVVNAFILASAWSSGNSLFYASTRILYAAALDRKAPALFARQRFGVPYPSVLATSLFGCLAYLNVSNRSADVFFWLSQICAVNTLVLWVCVSWTYLRFHRALAHHGVPRDSLPYKAPLQPYLARFALVFCVAVALVNGFDAFFPGRLRPKTLVPPYVNIPIFLSLFLGYKWAKGTKIVPIPDVDILSGKAEIDSLEPTWKFFEPRNWLEKLWLWIA